jgi:hypothetical protein
MSTDVIARAANQLKMLLSPQVLQRLGQQSGLVLRERLITAERLVLSLLQSLGSRKIVSLAELTRDFNADHGLAVYYKPFYQRLDRPEFAKLMRNVFDTAIATLHAKALEAVHNGPFASFKDILIQDGSSFAVHGALATIFPGRFTAVSPAAVELHCTMSLLTDSVTRMTLTADSSCERHELPEPRLLKDKLILGDRGYDSTKYMEEVREAGGFYLIRARKNLDPRVIKIYTRGHKYRKLEGLHLSDVLCRAPKKKNLDMDVCWQKGEEFIRPARLVVCYNPANKNWVRLMTNLCREKFSLEDIVSVYSLRWQIELLFKELKSHANLHAFVTRKKNIAEGLIWASLTAALIKRFIAYSCQLAHETAISTRRTATCGQHIFSSLLRSTRAYHRRLCTILGELFAYLVHNAPRANLAREKAIGRLQLGLTPAGTRLKG